MEELKQCSKCKEVLPVSSFSLRGGKNNRANKPRAYCKKCSSKNALKYRADHIEECLVKDREAKRKRRKEQPEKVREANQRSRLKHLAKCRQRAREYQINNKERINALCIKRNNKIKTATPPWADKQAMAQAYKEASSLGMCVDHIIPISNPNVSGLHVPWNLHIIPKEDNSKKFNRFCPALAIFAKGYSAKAVT